MMVWTKIIKAAYRLRPLHFLLELSLNNPGPLGKCLVTLVTRYQNGWSMLRHHTVRQQTVQVPGNTHQSKPTCTQNGAVGQCESKGNKINYMYDILL